MAVTAAPNHAPPLLGLLLLAGAALVVALGTGAIRLPPLTVLGALAGSAGTDPMAGAVVWTLRLPRSALATLAGAVLGLSGAIMQGLFRNPLADPGLLGVSAGGALGAVLAITLGLPWLGTAPAAFAGALLTTLLVLRVARHEGRVLVASLLLAGIVVNALAGAATSFLVFAADDMQLRDILFWTMGSVAVANGHGLLMALGGALPLLLAAPFLARALNALILGEREAQSLGIPLEATKLGTVVLVALAVGAAVAATGIIGFIGIVAPHLARLLRGADHRWVLPASALLGAALLTLADAAARVLVAPAELPVGLLTALLGGPFFLVVLLRRRRSVEGA